MIDTDFSTTTGIAITLILSAAVILVLRLAGSSFAGAFLLVTAIVIAVFILLVILIMVFSIGLGKKERRDDVARSGEIPAEVRAADRVLLDLIAVNEGVRNQEVKSDAGKLCDQCRMINNIAAKQPEELYKAELYFRSGLPMFLGMLESYVTQEPAGDPDLPGRMLTCMNSFSVLLDRQYRAFFTTVPYDFSGEFRILEGILKRNRLA